MDVEKLKDRNFLYYGLILAAWLLYMYLTFYAPLTPAVKTLGLHEFQLNLLRITITIPYLAIWLVTMYGILKLNSYVKRTRQFPDGKALSKLASGLLILLIGVVFSSVLSALRSFLTFNSEVLAPITILINYSYVVFPLIGFLFIFLGSKDIIKIVKKATIPAGQKIVYLAPLLLFAVLYVWFIFTNPIRQISTEPTIPATYYLPDSLIILTIILPVIIGWVLGILAALNFQFYSKNVKGIIYRDSLSLFVRGIYFIIGSSIFLQALLSLGSVRLINLGLQSLLILIYLFLAIQALGYYLIFLGSNKLTKIEDV